VGHRRDLVIVKLGGSVITDKLHVKKPNSSAINRLAEEMGSAFKQGVKLIIVHGGGSYGHPYAAKYELQKGYVHEGQLLGFAETRLAMEELNRMVVEALLRHGLPSIAVQPSACIVAENGEIKHFFTSPIETLLKIDCVPVLYGDVVVDLEKGFTVISGDKIISYLALHLGAKRVVFGCDVDGIYTSNPRFNSQAELIRKLKLDEAIRMLKCGVFEQRVIDVTGGMKAKLLEAIKMVSSGCEVLIVNAMKPDRLRRAVLGEEVIGTRIIQ